MRKIFTSILALFSIAAATAQTKPDSIAIWSQGKATMFALNAVDSITFTQPRAEMTAVDMGLSVTWGSLNLGATSPEDGGNYYAWGETETKDDYSWDTYKWGTSDSWTKYNSVDNIETLADSDDAATALLGGEWRMPTSAEVQELIENCTWTWTTQGGVNGYTVTAKNGNTIFLPAAGNHSYSGTFKVGEEGDYWTGSKGTGFNNYARYLVFDTEGADWTATDRCYGFCIRPVQAVKLDESDYVDLGLSVKWATRNLGADTPSAYGDYYAWGETATKETYSWDTYAWGDATARTKYTTTDGKTTLDDADDAATAALGSPWRTPTVAELQELIDSCTWTWSTQGGNDGYIAQGPNGNSIFLPAAGGMYNAKLYYAGNAGYYWANEVNSADDTQAQMLRIDKNLQQYTNVYRRFWGCSVRPVRP